MTFGMIKHNQQKEPDRQPGETEENKMTKIMENELNMVTGGNIAEIAYDSRALHQAGLIDEEFTPEDIEKNYLRDTSIVDWGWKKARITCLVLPILSNQYFMNGKKISHRDALRMIAR